MTEERQPLAKLLAKSGDGLDRSASSPHSVAEAMLQMPMAPDVEWLIGAGRRERAGERTNHRNGLHERTLDTRLGTCNCPHRSGGRAASSRLSRSPARAPRTR